MSEFGPDELFLRGRLQLEVALGALVFSSLNLDAERRIQAFLDIHSHPQDDQSQSNLAMYLQGGVVTQDKADIITGLDLLSVDQSASTEMRLAAQALREII